jgi:hypothetical protein
MVGVFMAKAQFFYYRLDAPSLKAEVTLTVGLVI